MSIEESQAAQTGIFDPLELLTGAQLAQLLGFSTGHLNNSRARGTLNLPFVMVGRAIRYRRSDIVQFLANNTFHNIREAKGPRRASAQTPVEVPDDFDAAHARDAVAAKNPVAAPSPHAGSSHASVGMVSPSAAKAEASFPVTVPDVGVDLEVT